jgi:hypothetical protein
MSGCGCGATALEERAVDQSTWDKDKAMSQCASSDDPAACYDSICAGKKAGDPANQDSHALPHHYPGKGPNADGVRNAKSRINQTDGLTNKADAEKHLDAHMTEIQAAEKSAVKNSWERPGAARSNALEHKRALSGPAARLRGFHGHFRHEPVKVNGKDLHQLDGYASVVGVEYEMYDMFGIFYERVAPEAFDVTLAANPDVAFLVNHKGLTMARTTNGTLQLEADPRGLHSLAYVNPQRGDVSDLLIAIDDENVTEMSFAFMIDDGEWDDEFEHFTIKQVNLDRGDVSAVNYGANPYTNIEGRSSEVLRDLAHLPEAAQYAAYCRMARHFGDPVTLRGAAMRAAGGAFPELDDRTDPVAQVAGGMSTRYYETLLSAD